MTRTGISQATGASGGSAWRGLSLYRSAGTTYTADSAIEFDTILADTDGIVSGGDTFGGITIPTNSSGTVPTGMAGLWRISANIRLGGASGFYQIEGGTLVNNFSGSYVTETQNPFADPTAVSLTIASWVRELAEGDVVWVGLFLYGGTSVDSGGNTFLMEYLGPA